MVEGRLQLFTGNANPRLAQAIASILETPLGRAEVGAFSDSETRVRLEENVRGSDVFVIQPLCAPVNQHIMELLIMLDAVRRASAARITAVIPYYAYARQEKKTAGREPISAKLLANLLTTAGADRILTVDLHAPAIEGFFDIPVDHLRATPILAAHARRLGLERLVVVSPDTGAVARAEEFRRRVGGGLAIISKQRPSPEMAEMHEMVGEVEGRDVIIVDDIIASGGTLLKAIELLQARGVRRIFAAAIHGVFSGDALRRIAESPIERVFVTDTIPLPDNGPVDKIEVLTVAPLLAEAIMRIHKDLSISALFT